MILLVRGAEVYAPQPLGVKDVLVAEGKIAAVGEGLQVAWPPGAGYREIDGRGLVLTPGFIDSHVHIIGGGGEGGFATRTPEITLSAVTKAGVTCLVGCLGTDGTARSLDALLAKARGLTEEGVTAYIYTGSYRVPPVTFTGDVVRDLMLIDRVIGVGEVAVADHRSTAPGPEAFRRLVAEARMGGVLSGKAGVVNVHLGAGKDPFGPLRDVAEHTELPVTQFLPTHAGGNPQKLADAMAFAKSGGFIDFTTSSDGVFVEDGGSEIKCSRALRQCLDAGVPAENVTFSSDAQGSMPVWNDKKELAGLAVGDIASLHAEVRDAALADGVPLETALAVVTANPARALGLRQKGHIAPGFDADLCLLDRATLAVHTVVAMGRVMVADGRVRVFGTFERPDNTRACP